MTLTKSPLAPIAMLITAIISVQVGAALSKSLFSAVGAEGATALRFGISAILLGAFFKPWRLKIDQSNWKILLLYGGTMCGACLFFYMALKTIPLGIASTIEFGGPITVAVISSRRVIHLFWIGLAVLGLYLLMPNAASGASSGPLDSQGIVYAILAGICWGGYILSGQKAGSDHAFQTTALGVVIAAIIVLPIGYAKAGLALFDLAILPLGLGLAILTSAIPFTLEMLAMQRISALAFGTLLSLEPAIASLVGFVFLHEALSLTQCLAIGLIVAASMGVTLSAGTKRP